MRLLKYTFAGDSVNLENSIQAGLGCVCLPAPIINANKVITDFGNFVAVQEHKAHTVDVRNLSIARLPINLTGDGGVHLGFDLTHGRGVGG